MTTIAWDGKTLAVDSRRCCGDTVTNNTTKKLFLRVGRFVAVAAAGSVGDIQKALRWVRAGEKGDMPEGKASLVCIDRAGKCWDLLFEYSTIQKNPGLVTEGSGWEIALGAMDAGATAVEAVKIACKRNVHTGGRIQSYTFNEVLK